MIKQNWRQQKPLPNLEQKKLWKQVILDFRNSPPTLLAERFQGYHMTPLEVANTWKYPIRPTVIYKPQETSTDIAVKSEPMPDGLKPASDICIMAHLARVTAQLPLSGINKESPELGNRQAIEKLKDYTARLVDKKVCE